MLKTYQKKWLQKIDIEREREIERDELFVLWLPANSKKIAKQFTK